MQESKDAYVLGEPSAYTEETYKTDQYKAFTEGVIADFRANNGQVGGTLEGLPLLLLTTTGAKSGQPRTTPVTYLTDNGRFVVIASRGDMPSLPAWYHNLRANPNVTIELGAETFPARATVTAGAERQRLFDQIAAHVPPSFREFVHNSHLELPVIFLERTG